jgi:hypothetical protein
MQWRITQHRDALKRRSLSWVRSQRARRMPIVAAFIALALAWAGCGGSAAPTDPSATRSPLAVSAPLHLCPVSDARPRLVLNRSATNVLVPGYPTDVLICRYQGFSEGHAGRGLAGARRVVRQDVTSYLASELDALGSPPKVAQSCPDFGGRSDLFVFRYPGAGTARVLLTVASCIPVTNGRVVRDGLGLRFRAGELHWPDEGLL